MLLTKSKPPARAKGGKKPPTTAQQTIPYRQMLPDGICRVSDQLYTKTIQYEDINYSVASTDDQSAIFDGYCAFLNYFDSALPFQLSFINHRSNPDSKYTVNIPAQQDEFNSVRGEYVEMLETQIAKSNNGIVRSKYITFGLAADSLTIARPRLERMEADIISNYKKLGVQRGLTTSSTAIFVPFLTQELCMDGQAVYYGMNALSHNIIMANRKALKNPKGLYCKGTEINRKTQASTPFAAQMGECKRKKGAQTLTTYQNLIRGSSLCRQQPQRTNAQTSLCA